MMGDHNKEEASSTLINRNVVIDSHRTSIRLEAEMWSDLKDICRREGKSVHEICTMVNVRKDPSRSLTSAIRVFLIAYYRSAATEDGHYRAGHGQDYQFVQRHSMGSELIGRAYSAEEVPPMRQNRYAFRTA